MLKIHHYTIIMMSPEPIYYEKVSDSLTYLSRGQSWSDIKVLNNISRLVTYSTPSELYINLNRDWLRLVVVWQWSVFGRILVVFQRCANQLTWFQFCNNPLAIFQVRSVKKVHNFPTTLGYECTNPRFFYGDSLLLGFQAALVSYPYMIKSKLVTHALQTGETFNGTQYKCHVTYIKIQSRQVRMADPCLCDSFGLESSVINWNMGTCYANDFTNKHNNR